MHDKSTYSYDEYKQLSDRYERIRKGVEKIRHECINRWRDTEEDSHTLDRVRTQLFDLLRDY